MPDETDVASRDTMRTIIEGARRRSPDIAPNDDTANKFPTMFDINTIAVLAGGIWQDAHLSAQFKIRSVRIDNGTNQWLQMGPNGDYIPPFTYGLVFNVRGQGSVEIFRAVPLNSGITQVAPVAGQSYTVTLYDKPQPPFQFSAQVPTGFRSGAQPIETIVAAGAFGTRIVTVPVGGPAWLIDTMALTFVTSAVVANRNLAIDFKDAAGNVILTVVDATAVPAGATRPIWVASGGTPGATTAPFAGQDFVNLPANVVLPPGGTITFRETGAGDAADTLAIVLIATPIGA